MYRTLPNDEKQLVVVSSCRYRTERLTGVIMNMFRQFAVCRGSRRLRISPLVLGAPYSSMGRATQIRRVEKWGDVEDFFDKGLPCIVTNGTLDWPAVEKWKKIEHLKKKYGDVYVPVEVGRNYVDSEEHQVLFGAFLDYVVKKGDPCFDDGTLPVLYLAQHDLFEQIPDLKKDIVTPQPCTALGNGDLYSTRAWISGAGTTSNAHTDPCHNFYCQTVGHKFFRLFFPETEDDMYPHKDHFRKNTSTISDVLGSKEELYEGGFERFVTQVSAQEATLGPGDALYIPKKMWHFATSKDVSIGVNFWWL